MGIIEASSDGPVESAEEELSGEPDLVIIQPDGPLIIIEELETPAPYVPYEGPPTFQNIVVVDELDRSFPEEAEASADAPSLRSDNEITINDYSPTGDAQPSENAGE